MESCFFLALLIVIVPPAAAATSHTVGGSAGWAVPTSPTFYDDWSANNTFAAGDSLVFTWTSMHDVLQVTTKAEYDKCTKTNGELKDKSPATIPLAENGTWYFICTIASHCLQGQKVTIKVGNAASSSPPASSSSPPPPASSSANPSVPIQVVSFLFFSSLFLHFLTLSA
ncbi:Cucumber peeling cupredoxin [Euphorbia peplus]|nr:Cucumber peeling cupredoxin [Euphorbia peplus]